MLCLSPCLTHSSSLNLAGSGQLLSDAPSPSLSVLLSLAGPPSQPATFPGQSSVPLQQSGLCLLSNVRDRLALHTSLVPDNPASLQRCVLAIRSRPRLVRLPACLHVCVHASSTPETVRACPVCPAHCHCWNTLCCLLAMLISALCYYGMDLLQLTCPCSTAERIWDVQMLTLSARLDGHRASRDHPIPHLTLLTELLVAQTLSPRWLPCRTLRHRPRALAARTEQLCRSSSHPDPRAVVQTRSPRW